MYISDIEEITPHGGSMRVTIHKKGHSAPETERYLTLTRQEESSLTFEKMQEFRQTSEVYVKAFKDKLTAYKAEGLRVAGYSAPARVSTICNFGNIGPDLIEFLVDDSPLKQNRTSPGTHIPIVNKEYLDNTEVDVLVIFAYEYLDDIRAKTNGKNYRYLVPIPPKEYL